MSNTNVSATVANVSSTVSAAKAPTAAEKRIAKAIRLFAVAALDGAAIDIEASIENFRACLATATIDFKSFTVATTVNPEIDAVVVQIFAGATTRIPLPTLEMTVAVRLAKNDSNLDLKEIAAYLKSCLVQGRLSAAPGRAGGIALTDKFTSSESEDSEEVDCAAE